MPRRPRSQPKPPKGLSRQAGAFWRQVVQDFQLEPHHFEILAQACTCLDRIEAARRAIAERGALVEDRFGQLRQNPAVQVELQASRLFQRSLRELGLDVAAPDEGYARPPRLPPGGRQKKGGR